MALPKTSKDFCDSENPAGQTASCSSTVATYEVTLDRYNHESCRRRKAVWLRTGFGLAGDIWKLIRLASWKTVFEVTSSMRLSAGEHLHGHVIAVFTSVSPMSVTEC